MRSGLGRTGRWPRRSAVPWSRCCLWCCRASSAPLDGAIPRPFADVLPDFFDHLADERGLGPASLRHYRHHLDGFEAYLSRIGVRSISELSPTVLSGFIAERSGVGLAKSTVRGTAGVLRAFLRYAYREGVLATDLSGAVEWPQLYRLSSIPRSTSWEEVNRTLAAVDRRTEADRRDYAILLLLITYGLRGRDVAALTLDHIDWKRERLAVPERKAGHSTAFPLSVVVGEALLDSVRHAAEVLEATHVPIKEHGLALIQLGAHEPLARRREQHQEQRELREHVGQIDVDRPEVDPGLLAQRMMLQNHDLNQRH